MKILNDSQANISLFEKGLGVTLGKFDGVHLGHQFLISHLSNKCKEHGLSSAVFTFKNHPRKVLGCRSVSLLSTKSKKEKIISNLEADYLIYCNFDREFTSMTPKYFVEEFLVKKHNVKMIVVGHDFRFGHKRSGDLQMLKELAQESNIEVEIIGPIEGNKLISGYNKNISSSLIRKEISSGNVKYGAILLGRYYSLEGVVVKGEGMGRKLGYRTINMQINSDMLLPADGGYITLTKVGDVIYKSITNIGFRPTFGGLNRTVETHIFDFDKDIYGEHVEVYFIERLRGETKFEKVEQLVERIRQDVEYAKEYLHNFDDYTKIL